MSAFKDLLQSFLFKSFKTAFLMNLTGRILSFALFIFLARQIGVHEFGILMIALAWLQILLIFGRLGHDAGASRFLPLYQEQSRWSEFHANWRMSLSAVLVQSLVVSGMASIALAAWGWHKQTIPEISYYIAFAMLPFSAGVVYLQSVLRALGHVKKSFFPDTLLRPCLFWIFVLSIPVWGLEYNPRTALVAGLCAVALAFTLSLIWVVQNMTGFPEQKSRDFSLWKIWMKYGLVMALFAGGAIIMRQTDVLMVGAMVNEQAAGLYGAAARLTLAAFGLIAPNLIMSPLISSANARKKPEQMQRLLTKGARLIAMLSGTIMLVLFVFANSVLSVFGPEYVEGAAVLRILLAAQGLILIAGPAPFFMSMTGHEKMAAAVFLVVALGNIPLNVALISLFGMQGAAWSTLVSIFVWNLFMVIYIRVNNGFDPSIFGRPGPILKLSEN